jgi:methionyl-tRNA formyltransferase
MRLAFMGTPEFSVPALEALLAAGHEVACVYSQPPRPVGRGHQTRPSPVHERAEAAGIEVRTPTSLRMPDVQEAFAALNLDAAVVVAYGLILPQPVLDAPRLGCVNIHGSLLPRWRGAAPIQRAIEAGDAETGITTMAMDAGLDTGAMLLTAHTPIGADDDAGSLHDRLAAMGASLIVETLAGLEAGTITPVPQPGAGVTYAAKLDKAEAALDWNQPAEVLARKVRAFRPWPGTTAQIEGQPVKVLSALAVAGQDGAAPGTILSREPIIACAGGSGLWLERLQRPGKGPVPGADFWNGVKSLQTGDQLA